MQRCLSVGQREGKLGEFALTLSLQYCFAPMAAAFTQMEAHFVGSLIVPTMDCVPKCICCTSHMKCIKYVSDESSLCYRLASVAARDICWATACECLTLALAQLDVMRHAAHQHFIRCCLCNRYSYILHFRLFSICATPMSSRCFHQNRDDQITRMANILYFVGFARHRCTAFTFQSRCSRRVAYFPLERSE